MTKSSLIKFLGMTATVVGMAAELLSNWVNEKQIDKKIDEKVNEALAKRNEES